MTAVIFKFQRPDQTPVADVPFTVTLRKPTFDEAAHTGILLPGDVQGITNAQGECTLDLAHGYGTYYLYMDLPSNAEVADGCLPGLRYKFVVPAGAGPFRVEDLIVSTPTWSRPWDEQALAIITDAKNSAINSAAAAAQSASNAHDSDVQSYQNSLAAGTQANNAKTSATNAKASENSAAASRDNAALLAEQARVSAVNSGNSANASAQSATASAQSAQAAQSSRDDAATSAGQASASASTASGAASTATQARDAAAASAAAALASKNSAETAANTATTKANEASASAGTALTQANRAKTEADRATAATDGKQDKNANLTAISGLVGAADRMIFWQTPAQMAVSALTSKGRGILAQANNAGVQAEIGLVPTASMSDTTAGRIMTVGYGGLGYADNAPSAGTGLNPDTYRTGQFSIFGQFALGAGWGTRTGWLSVFPGDANNVAQTFTSGDSERWSLQRVQSGGVWSDWAQPFAQTLNKGAFNANNLPPGTDWTVTGTDSQAASNNWPVIAGGNAGTAVWWNISTRGVSNRTTQIAIQAYNGNNGVTFIRSKHDSTWSAWQEIYTTANVTKDAQANGILSSASIGGWRLTKYRNGMFLCSRSHPNFAMAANGTTRSNFTLPITASYTPECSVIVSGVPEASDDWYGVTAKALDSATTGFFKVRNGATPQQLQQINVTVIGFWN